VWESFLSLWSDRTFLRDIVKENPFLGALIFVLLQALQVIIAPLPGEVTGFIGGFLFGAFVGFVLSTIGILLGSGIAFTLMRKLRRQFFTKYEANPYYFKVKRVFRRYGLYGVFLLYLFPGFPKDLLNYLMAFMPISFRTFMIVSNLGRAPGTLALAIQGDVVYGGHPYRIIIVTGAFILAFLLFLLFKKRLENYLNATT